MFNLIFILTMTIDNQDLYLGYGQNWLEVKTNNKLPLQREIFVFGLVIILTILNVAERVLSIKPRLLKRAIKTIVSVIAIYLINWKIFEILDVDFYCLYLYHRGIPAISLCIATLGFLAIILLLFEGLTSTKFYDIIRKIILLFIPGFVKRKYNENYLQQGV